MTIQCPSCGRVINVPDDKAANPRLRVKCRCETVFALADARTASTVVAGTPAARGSVASPAAPPLAAAPLPARRPADAGPAPLSTAAASPVRAATASPATPEPALAVPGAASADATATPRPRPPRPGAWRRCTNHPQAPSVSFCRNCNVGYCEACEKRVQSASICSACDSLCVSVKDHEAAQARQQQRDRSMAQDIGIIVAYPLTDRFGFVLLALFTGFFALAAKFAVAGGGIAILLSQGVLMSYCFQALTKVSNGNLKDYMPDFTDITDLIRPLRLGFAALLVSMAPLILLVMLAPGADVVKQFWTSAAPQAAVHAQPPEAAPSAESEPEEPEAAAESAQEGELAPWEQSEKGPSLWVFLLILAAVVWYLGYMPAALTVAAISRSFVSTVNPLLGVHTIQKMGAIYWQAMGIYTVLAVGQVVLGLIFGLIPVVGVVFRTFVDAYCYLAIGCTLGLAVFKKAPELGLD